jgi:hypothetical protein
MASLERRSQSAILMSNPTTNPQIGHSARSNTSEPVQNVFVSMKEYR